MKVPSLAREKKEQRKEGGEGGRRGGTHRVDARASEEIAHARGADAHNHLHELRARKRVEGDARLARDGLRKGEIEGQEGVLVIVARWCWFGEG